MSNTKSKFDTISLVICAVLLVAVILAIVGVCVNYVTYSYTNKITESLSYSKSYKLSAEGMSEVSGYGAMAAFAYITLVLAIVTLALYMVTKFVDIKAVKLATFVVSALLVICAIVALITAYTFGNAYSTDLASAGYGAGAGAWLLAIGGIIGGAAGIVGTYTVLKK